MIFLARLQHSLKFFYFALFLLTISGFVNAHEIRPAIIDLFFDQQAGYQISIKLNLEAMLAKIEPQHERTDQSKNAAYYAKLRQMNADQLNVVFDAFTAQFLAGIYLYADAARLRPSVTAVNIPAVGDIELARDSVVVITGLIPNMAQGVVWSWDASFGAHALRVSSVSEADVYTAYLLPGVESAVIPLRSEIIKQSTWSIFQEYGVIGFKHIVPKGLDHIFFVVGLFLLNTSLHSLLWQMTSFTLAHSVTLALGVLGLVKISAAIVEPLIACSIIYVCLDNIYSDQLNRWRPMVIFAFGLLHGLGFSNVLIDIGLSSNQLVTGLIGFNLGVEVGQLSIILFCFYSFGLWLCKKKWYRQRVTIPLSALISCVGGYWLIERILYF